MQRSVVITGLGPINAFGLGIDPLWNALIEGKSAIGPILRFAPGDCESKVAAEVSVALSGVTKIVPR